MTLFADDPDVHHVYPITDEEGADVDFSVVVMATQGDEHIELDVSWVGDPAATRNLRVSFAGLAPNVVTALRLVVPGDNDVELEDVVLT